MTLDVLYMYIEFVCIQRTVLGKVCIMRFNIKLFLQGDPIKKFPTLTVYKSESFYAKYMTNRDIPSIAASILPS